jgi:hypothetical protein
VTVQVEAMRLRMELWRIFRRGALVAIILTGAPFVVFVGVAIGLHFLALAADNASSKVIMGTRFPDTFVPAGGPVVTQDLTGATSTSP